jgi:hypothetical protein
MAGLACFSKNSGGIWELSGSVHRTVAYPSTVIPSQILVLYLNIGVLNFPASASPQTVFPFLRPDNTQSNPNIMKNAIKLLTILTLIISLSSFTGMDSTDYSGTYGVSSSDPSQIKLIIHADHSFYYQDLSIPAKKIVVNGSWTQTGKKLILHANGSEQKIHNVWTFEENGNVANSRKGLTFYRLAKIEE